MKGGENVNVAMVRDLAHVVDSEKAKIGVFITLAEPTGPMKTEAVKTGFYDSGYGKFPKIQIITIRELLDGKKVEIPFGASGSGVTGFKKAKAEDTSQQGKLI